MNPNLPSKIANMITENVDVVRKRCVLNEMNSGDTDQAYSDDLPLSPDGRIRGGVIWHVQIHSMQEEEPESRDSPGAGAYIEFEIMDAEIEEAYDEADNLVQPTPEMAEFAKNLPGSQFDSKDAWGHSKIENDIHDQLLTGANESEMAARQQHEYDQYEDARERRRDEPGY